MTLRRKMGLQITSMIVGLLLITFASLWGLNGLRQDYGSAVAGLREMRQIFEVGAHVAVARTLLLAPQPDVRQARGAVQAAVTRFEAADPWVVADPASRETIHDGLQTALVDVQRWHGDSPPPTDSLNDVLGQITQTVADVRNRVQASQAAAERKRRTTLLAVGSLSSVIVLAAVLMGLWQYRSVISPLHRLGAAVRRVATGQFGVRIEESGLPSGANNEFASLASDFNRMAEELDSFYRELEQKVAAKSKELIRSERLASVGYLAAGVAHEINNPLGIISGYAEYALAEMKGDRAHNSASPGDIDSTLRVIRDEAFRCKDITGKLLSLARPGDSQRHRVNLADVAEQVVSILAGLRDFKQRTITVRAEQREHLFVDAIEGEMKQVIMNLLINALEATDDGAGEVRVIVTHSESPAGPNGVHAPGVILTVSDNGRGMSAETLERVFEPFFTDRRPREPGTPARPGTGLGLSITHAIVQSHHGRISAQSDGVGMGSRFVMELPAAQQSA